MDTIFATATARGKAGVAVIRISGPEAKAATLKLAGSLPETRLVSLRKLFSASGEFLDEALVLIFDSGKSFTGEDVAELHLHGSMATVQAVLSELSGFPGLRMAEPGEFTRRALVNDRLDLAQVEGLADLIEAETEAQRKQALRVFSGGLGDMCQSWRTRLVRAASLLEATIDFVDEDVPVDVGPEVMDLLSGVAKEVEKEASGVEVAERIRDGFEVAIVGPPNAGKSTLLNALAGREAAITSEVAGTTRDIIEVRMDLKGLPVTFLDTAGLRETSDEVELIGVERALERARQADIRVVLDNGSSGYSGLDISDLDILVTAKGDLNPNGVFPVSGKTGLGIADLVDRIAEILETKAASAAVATRERHRVALVRAKSALENALIDVRHGSDRAELAAEELRTAIRALDSLIGLVDVEHLLDEIFSNFCIGK